MKKILGAILMLSIALLMAESCKHKPEEIITGNGNNGGVIINPQDTPCNPDVVYFNKDILPILISNCAMSGCHDNGTAAEGIVLTSYDWVIRTGGIKAGNPNRSELYEVVVTSDPGDRMPPPPKTKLTQDQIGLISKWITQGAQNLNCNSGCDTTSVTYSATISPLVNKYCTGCHNSVSTGGGLNLTTYSGMAAIAADGRLLGSVNKQSGYVAMPQGSSLDNCQIAKLRIWVKAGYPNN